MHNHRKPYALRLILLGVGIVMLLGALHLWSEHDTSGVFTLLAVYGGLIVISILIERSGYRPDVDTGDRGWQPTDEKFIDPVTGEPVQVWFNAKTGERDYRPTHSSRPR